MKQRAPKKSPTEKGVLGAAVGIAFGSAFKGVITLQPSSHKPTDSAQRHPFVFLFTYLFILGQLSLGKNKWRGESKITFYMLEERLSVYDPIYIKQK